MALSQDLFSKLFLSSGNDMSQDTDIISLIKMFARQYNTSTIKGLMTQEYIYEEAKRLKLPKEAKRIRTGIKKLEEMIIYFESQQFVNKGLESMSLHKFMKAEGFNVKIDR